MAYDLTTVGEGSNVDELINLYLQSTETMLRRVDLPDSIIQELLAAIRNASVVAAARSAERVRTASGLAFATPMLADLLPQLAHTTKCLRRDEVRLADLEQSVVVMISAAKLCLALSLPATAYNFYEVAYHLGSIFDRPALDVATKLRELSNPSKVDQFHGAIWRYAIESVRFACETKTEWVDCLDAVELALVCPVVNPRLQTDLFQHLRRQISKAQNTKIEELAIIVAVQAPHNCWEPAQRRAAATMILTLSGRYGNNLGTIEPEVMEVLSNVEAQVMFDDMRQLVAVNSLVVPQITWHDVTLRHQRLATAVPVGRSLVADPARTGLFLLDLAHEIGHAFVLQGPIGMRQAAFRAAIHYLELELLNAFPQGEMLSTTNEIQVSSELPDGTRAQALAETQAAVALRAAIEQAVWTPWLEGVSMYIELLCDPKDDPTEISGVHSCIRSLIDFNIPQDDGESSDDYLKRFADMAAQQFEDFFSKVLRKRARLNLLSYLDDAQGTRRVRSDMYCLGFLIVRSVVSAWEATLGARLAPVVALKLLLNATKGATFDAFPDARDIDAHYMELCQINFFAWLKNLASLSKHILADFFVAVRPSEVGASWIWKDGIPYKNLESSTEADEENARRFNELNELAVALSAGKSTSPLPTYSVRTETVLELVNQYLAWNRLLPVGRDRARLLFFDSPGRVGLCIRSYTGDVNLGTGAEKAYRNDPRYNHTVWTLKGGKNEADQLRRACGTAGSARLLTTRIIDFGGLLDSPSPSGSTSYLCSFLKSEFARIVPWSTHVDIASAHPKFVKLLESRVFPPLTFADEENTLASLSFLARRLEKSSSGHSVSSLAMSIDFHKGALDVAMEASAMAFSQSSVNFFRESYEQTMNTTDGRLAFARAVFATGVGQPAPVEAMLHGKSLPTIILDSQSPSGIRRFGAAS